MALPQSLQDPLALPRAGAPLFIVSTPDLVPVHGKAGITGPLLSLSARSLKGRLRA